ncbi:hypothetical protein HY504_03505 [Candidatus Wolfebacteria bacterium]|nr:hypothetical protein [Candidatus Wolfebacteria bacterium]
MYQTWTDVNWVLVTKDAFSRVLANVIGFVPDLLGALVLLIVGLIVAAVIRYAVQELVRAIRLDVLLRNVGVETYVARAGFALNSAKFFGLLLYWFVIIVFLLAIADALDLDEFSFFLRDVVAYARHIIVAVIIMLAAFVLANFARSLIRGSVTSAKLHSPGFLGALAWWAIVIFGLVQALVELQVAEFVLTVVTGFIYMVALAGGIAFGLGGKEYAARLIERLRNETGGE